MRPHVVIALTAINLSKTKGANIDTFKRIIYAYLLLTVGVLLISFAMNMNGNALPNNPAWILIKNLRTILLWIGAIPLVLWGVCTLIEWQVRENQKQILERRNEIEEMIQIETTPISNRHLELANQVQVLKRQLDEIEKERRHEKIIKLKLAEKQNRSADEITHDALSDFI